MRNLEIRVSSRTVNGSQSWEGTISVPGTRPTKLVRNTGETTYSSRSSLLSSARNFAKKIGFDGVAEPVAKTTKKPVTKKIAPVCSLQK